MKITAHYLTRLALAAALSTASAFAAGPSEKKMLTQAKVDRTHAEKIALGAARGGKIKSGEIEREKGRLVWSFDIAKPNTADVTEVLVDAATGKIVSVKKENAAKEAAEARADAQQKH